MHTIEVGFDELRSFRVGADALVQEGHEIFTRELVERVAHKPSPLNSTGHVAGIVIERHLEPEQKMQAS